ncbi:MAG: ATP-binding protein [Deltaproteobacteria bacterium]|nr:ATP-binding protein [Deltaproteobacteria bacterium]
MMDWSALDPGAPLQGYEPEYVEREHSGDRIAVLVRHGLAPVAITGPAGSGRSTELHRVRGALGGGYRPIEVDLARLIQRHGREHYLHAIAEHLVDRLVDEDLSYQPTTALIEDIRASDPAFSRGPGKVREPLDLLTGVLGELGEHLDPRRLVLLFDGLDEASDAQGAALLRVLRDVALRAPMVVVVPPSLVAGPAVQDLLASFRLMPLPILPPEGDGAPFLRELLRRRLGAEDLPAELEPALAEAIRLSGGFPRTFLRLMKDAAIYGQIDGLSVPDQGALGLAVADQLEAIRRQLEAGDLEALAAADGSEGLGIPAAQRARLLTQGFLVEYQLRDRTVVHPHPLLRHFLDQRDPSEAPTP